MGDLAQTSNILEAFLDVLKAEEVVGERRVAQLVYLAVSSRVLDRPVSIVIKGPSAAGKSYLIQRVLNFFPAEAYYALTGMSERLLAYDDESLRTECLSYMKRPG